MIIQSLLENDLYSFTQQQAILHHFPFAEVEYEFKCRNDFDILPLSAEIHDEILHLCSLRFTDDDLNYLRSLSIFDENYLEYLRAFQLNHKHVTLGEKDGKFTLTIKGNWFHTILFEVPLLAIVSEVCLRSQNIDQTALTERLLDKINLVSNLKDFRFSDFGLRRRLSSSWHNTVVYALVTSAPKQFIGTSNVYLAKRYNTKPIGTMSHQWLMGGQGLSCTSLQNSQKYMLDLWMKEYRGKYAIALSDTLGFDAFLRDFDKHLASIYEGCRHDSGDPVEWGEKLIAHYIKLGINPRTKTAVFSDGLTFPTAIDLYTWFHGRIGLVFGIGTNLTNDVMPIQNVIKLVRVNGNPVAKISDSPGKGMCQDNGFLTYLRSVMEIK